MANKSSRYVEALVDFIRDTKPYHSKLTEVTEEYQFFDEMAVRLQERSSARVKLGATWLHSFFASGDPDTRTMPIHSLYSPGSSSYPFLSASLDAGLDAVSDVSLDLGNIPFTYSKKTFDGIGIADVLIDRGGSRTALEPLLEGHDWFESHGAFQFTVRQTTDVNTNFIPVWAELRDLDVISTASAYTRTAAMNLSNPDSAVNQINALLDQIDLVIQGLPASAESVQADAELQTIQAIIGGGTLPSTYLPLLYALVNASAPVLSGYAGWIGDDTGTLKYVSDRFSALTPALFFNTHSDFSTRESGKAEYSNVRNSSIEISNIVSTSVPGDAWIIRATSASDPIWEVHSELIGYIGVFDSSSTTTFSTSYVSFDVSHLTNPAIGEELIIRNRNRVVFGPSAPLETWNIVKVNPLAYSRPALISTRYGHIESATGTFGAVTILSSTIPSGNFTLTARADGVYFDLTSEDGLYTGLAQVNTLYNDGVLSFSIVAGTEFAFREGDRFYIRIRNEPVQVLNLELGYGYDLDSYDAVNLPYSTTVGDSDYGKNLNFVYDTRFTDYDVSLLGLTVQESAISGRAWRLRAIPNLSRPITTIKKDGSTGNAIDLQAETSGIAPDVSLTATPLYSMLGDANPAPDLLAFYADSFAVEYSDDNWSTVTFADVAFVGIPYSSSTHGISFTLSEGSKPFIAVQSDDGLAQPVVEGGDVFSFEVLNPAPELLNAPIGLSSNHAPRLIMHGDAFHETAPADFTVMFSGSSTFSVTSSAAGTSSFTLADGNSVSAYGTQFTIVPGSGLAAGDSFVFETYDEKPTYLVHGSISGWQQPATVGKTYWNGIIGFRIQEPVPTFYSSSQVLLPIVSNAVTVGSTTITITRLRQDAPTMRYFFEVGFEGWVLRNDTFGVLGRLPQNGTYSDKYITLTSVGANPSDVTPISLRIQSDDFDLSAGQDIVILNSTDTLRDPKPGDRVRIDKRTVDNVTVSLDYTAAETVPNITPLHPETIYLLNIDTNTGSSGVPLAVTSPETAILRDWIPLSIVPFDVGSSPAIFSDLGTKFSLISNGTGETIGTLTNTVNGAELEWFYDDSTPAAIAASFVKKYLPLNTNVSVVTYGAGLNDRVRVRITESVKFLSDPGPLSSDATIHETLTFSIQDEPLISVRSTNEETPFNVTVVDGPFGGFMAGYDTDGYDVSGYDNGVPLTSYYHEAQQLSGMDTLSERHLAMSPEERDARRDALVNLIQPFLVGGDLANTTLDQFLAAVEADPTNSLLEPGFGLPVLGHAISTTLGAGSSDVNNSSTEGAVTSFQDTAAMVMTKTPTIGPVERYSLFTVFGLPPVPNTFHYGLVAPVSPPVGAVWISGTNVQTWNGVAWVPTAFADFDVPLVVPGDVTAIPVNTTVYVNFARTELTAAIIDSMPIPKIYAWVDGSPAPVLQTLTVISAGRYTFSVPSASTTKIFITPGS